MHIDTTGTCTDSYQIAMGQSLFRDGSTGVARGVRLFFRKIPSRWLRGVRRAGRPDRHARTWRFTADDIDFLAGHGFDAAYLIPGTLRFSAASPRSEGDVVFCTAPILRVERRGEAQLIEPRSTRSTSSRSSPPRPRASAMAGDAILSESGLRRAQGPAGVPAARRHRGFDSTSNVYAAQRHGLRAEGTMAHSFIQWHGDEPAVFRAFAQRDRTTPCCWWIPTARWTARTQRHHQAGMAARGHRAARSASTAGSGLFARRARAMLDDAGLTR